MCSDVWDLSRPCSYDSECPSPEIKCEHHPLHGLKYLAIEIMFYLNSSNLWSSFCKREMQSGFRRIGDIGQIGHQDQSCQPGLCYKQETCGSNGFCDMSFGYYG